MNLFKVLLSAKYLLSLVHINMSRLFIVTRFLSTAHRQCINNSRQAAAGTLVTLGIIFPPNDYS